MGYIYDPSDLGLAGPKGAPENIEIGKAPKTSKYLNPYNYLKGQKKLQAWQDKKDLQAKNISLYNDYLYQRDNANEQFDQQVRDLRNYASQRNWSRGSSTGRQKDRVVGQWGSELNQLDTNYENSKQNLKDQLDYIEKKLRMDLEGISLQERNTQNL